MHQRYRPSSHVHRTASIVQRLVRISSLMNVWGLLRLAPIHLLMAALAYVLIGCAAISRSMRDQISDAGAQGTAVDAFGSIFLLRNVNYLPGARSIRSVKMQEVICESADTGMRVHMRLRESADPQQTICRKMMQAIRYVLRFREPKVFLSYEVIMVPPGVKFSNNHVEIGMRELRPVYAVRERSSDSGEAINTIAHETLHLTAGLNRFDAQRKTDESMAYFTGACAQLSVTGTLSRSDLVTNQFADGAVPKEAVLSAQAGSKVLEEVFSGNPEEAILADSDAGKQLLQRCEMRLQKFFTKNVGGIN